MYVDHRTLRFDASATFIEDDFLHSRRLGPATDARPDPRPTVREDVPRLGDRTSDVDVTQVPGPPMLLPIRPKATVTGTPRRAPEAVETAERGRSR